MNLPRITFVFTNYLNSRGCEAKEICLKGVWWRNS